MNYKSVQELENGVAIKGIIHFSLPDTLENGQCFRWTKINDHHYEGIAFNKKVDLVLNDDELFISGITEDEFENYWKDYFDLQRDYGEILKLLSTDETLKKSVDFAPGLRVLKQEPWEALITFILSQNNNIKRIRGLVDRFCETFGSKIDGGYAFPTIKQVKGITIESLEPVRAGFRAKYIVDAVEKVISGQVSLVTPYTLPIEEARNHLMQIKGVGPKVADCVLLFGFNRIEAMPVDVWIKRALEKFYPDGFPEEFSDYAGLAQQYLFHYTRLCDKQ